MRITPPTSAAAAPAGADSAARSASRTGPSAAPVRLDPRLAPIHLVEVECADPPALRPAGSATWEPVEPLQVSGPVLALARLHGSPIGLVRAQVDDPADALATVLAAARAELGEDIRRRLRQPPGPAGPRTTGAPAAEKPMISVVIATRERPEQLARCLESVARLRYRDYEVIVVDNAPASGATERLVRERFGHLVEYVTEPRRGLAAAHNRGLAAATGEIVAFTDDDVIVDPDWLTALAAGFTGGDVGCVTGLILPAELDTAAQIMIETHGRFGKGFEQRRHSIREPGPDPLFPFTAGRFGSGANMAFRTRTLAELGGFDPATGAGSRARGGDDLLAFFRTIAAGHTLVYQPEAVIWHYHGRTVEALERQAYGYGVGFGAFLTAALVNEPRMLVPFLRRVPRGVIEAVTQVRSRGQDTPGWPRELSWAQARGLLYGPIAYARSRRAVAAMESP
ncbi:MAG: glycosyltransferase [Catenulispora sp.]